MLALSYMRRTRYNGPVVTGKTHAGGGREGRFLFAASCAGAFSREWWPAPATARHRALVRVRRTTCITLPPQQRTRHHWCIRAFDTLWLIYRLE